MIPILKSEKVRAKPVILLQNATGKGSQWSYLERRPPTDWIEVGFDDKDWKSGMGGFGTKGTPGSQVRTVWNSKDIWMRTTFRLGSHS